MGTRAPRVHTMSALQPRHEILRTRIEQFTRTLHGVSDGDTRAIHRMRIATRRLRELLPVLPGGGEEASKINRRLRRITRQFGPLRELDVTAQLIDELRKSHRTHRAGLDRLARQVADDRAAMRERVVTKRASEERSRIARRLAALGDAVERRERSEVGESREHARAWRWAVQARVVRRADRLRLAIDAAGAVYLPERLHIVRIAVKKLRYTLELLEELGGASAADLRALKEKQDVLGRMHDLQGLMARARTLEASGTDGPIDGESLDALVDMLEDQCRRLHARYVGDRQTLAALAARLGARRREPVARAAHGRSAVG
jgi:CHAD domain-containing protein